MSQEPYAVALKNRRLALGLTQDELAKKASMSPKTLQRIENAQTDLRVSQFRKLLQALECTDLDISLDLVNVEGATPWDVAAAARVLLPESRAHLVAAIMSEWRRTEHLLTAEIQIKDT
ncbi:helix-turn-helix transcriptional regulator [Vibrio sp. S9_S30]|uniref:helix-turn-helix domain-containing protein n=1 Tax=Vibrio sp. S9_S30 TaxID=2720226 RepID=UPI001680A12B|nr:helix-turn-helix transcriptional regulator [Vibrio sp. S9_S30]